MTDMSITRALASLAWTATTVLAGILLGRAIYVVQCPDRAPLDRRDARYLPDDLEEFIRSAVVIQS